MPRRPRWIKGDAAYSETQRSVDRQFLFKPDEQVRNIIGSAAGRAQAKFPVTIYYLDFNSTHRQSGRAPISDSPEHLENVMRFDQMFSSLVAREINKYLGREGPIYSTRNRIIEVVDDPSLEQQLLYAVTNPVKDGLVDRVAQWKGFSSYEQLATGKMERFSYIDWTAWHRAGGKRSKKSPEMFMKQTEVKLTPIPAWANLPEHKRQALFRRRVREIEKECREERKRKGRSVMGPRKLAKLDHRDRPKNPPKDQGPQPICHASTLEAAREYGEKLKDFLESFYYASGHWMNGNYQVEFPRGSFKPPLLKTAA